MVTILKVAVYLALILAFSLLLPTALGADSDSDGLDDDAESTLCGRDAVRQALAATDSLTGAGQCASSTDFNPGQTIRSTQDYDGDHLPDSLEAELCSKFADPPAGQCTARDPNNPEQKDDFVPPTSPALDSDGDTVPDDLEPAICLAEDQNTELDGRCDGSDYHPVRAPGPSDFDSCRTPGATWEDVAYNFLRDTDCDGSTTQEELNHGCNPVDPTEHPYGSDCIGHPVWPVDADGDGVPDRVEPQVCAVQNPDSEMDGRCEGTDYTPVRLWNDVDCNRDLPHDPLNWVYMVLGNADCDGRTNEEELLHDGTNPLDPES